MVRPSIMSVAEEHTLHSDGLRLHVRHWPRANAKGVVALVHGLAEHAGRYGHVAKSLGDRGYDVWGLDLRGHGRSEGERVYVADLGDHVRDVSAFVAFVRKNAGNLPLYLLAHSMGGCISTLYVLRDRPRLEGLILSGPALKLGEDFNPAKIAAGRALGRIVPKMPIEKLKSDSISRDPEVVRAYDQDPLVYRGWIKTGFGLAFIRATEEIDRRMDEIELPLLVLQGGSDKIINRKGGAELYRRARSADKKLVIYEELYHEIFNEPEKEKVLSDLGTWLDAHVGGSAVAGASAS